MTRPVAVVTDSTADLPPALAAEAGITVVPLQVLWEGRTYQDGVDLTADAFYARLRTAASMPTTSHPSPETFAAIYRRWHARGKVRVRATSVGPPSRISNTGKMRSALARRYCNGPRRPLRRM